MSGRLFNVVITDSPGPRMPLCAGQARMVGMLPVMHLVCTGALAMGVTSCRGGVRFDLDGDRKAPSDVDMLAGMTEEAVEELKGAHW
jgi:diacylglycerol O-acyltransferase